MKPMLMIIVAAGISVVVAVSLGYTFFAGPAPATFANPQTQSMTQLSAKPQTEQQHLSSSSTNPCSDGYTLIMTNEVLVRKYGEQPEYGCAPVDAPSACAGAGCESSGDTTANPKTASNWKNPGGNIG